MQERINQIWIKVKEFWNKYSSKQKAIVFSVIGTVVLAVVILTLTLTRTEYVALMKCQNTQSASEVVDLLAEEGIPSELSNDLVTVMVDESNLKNAMILVGKSDITDTEMSYEDAFNNDMSTSESEKKLKTTLALQAEVRQKLLLMDGIKDATVFINMPTDDFTILTETNKATVSVMLAFEKNEGLATESASHIASFLANIVGSTTENITIIDDKGNMLFGGESDDFLGGNVSSVLDYKQKLSNVLVNNVKQVLLKYGSYKDVEVGAANIKFDMDKVSELYTEYTPAEGQEQGLLGSSYTYKSTGTNGASGTPGTDANDDDTSYEVGEDTGSNSSQESVQNTYTPNTKVTNTEYEVGAVMPESSSIAIVLTSYKVYNQADVERQGLLEGITWEDFVRTNDVKVQQDVDDVVYNLVESATGISTRNITITAWEQPIFQEIEEIETNYDMIIMIVLIILIVALLLFVVFKVTKPVDVTELEPELSVEELLSTTKENQSLEDIEYGEKSETRMLIEKFVDENPEAVAQLLRNWLNEDWG